ncbi:hypothetical protein [Paraliobacillus ryukyuensis]|uniref:hypothetical protein n=1 Tax=Paraliobacillus ryukyuensis TaxID=200904 RepID=UPI0009A735EE|nr:hypothetical protein [Paraliobacillus ryukyuensis]
MKGRAEVQIITKSKEVLKGFILDKKELKLIGNPIINSLSNLSNGVFLFTGKNISFIDFGEIENIIKL